MISCRIYAKKCRKIISKTFVNCDIQKLCFCILQVLVEYLKILRTVYKSWNLYNLFSKMPYKTNEAYHYGNTNISCLGPLLGKNFTSWQGEVKKKIHDLQFTCQKYIFYISWTTGIFAEWKKKKSEERIFYVDICKGWNFHGTYTVILWKQRNDGGIKISLIMFMCDLNFSS